jgi:glycosyltransferase involved in cell wall biosynthesis
MHPLITFAIPFYSNLGFLRRALESVRRQTVQDFRCVVIDDGGPEPEAAGLVASMRDSRFSFRRNEINLGLAGNFNACLDAAETELVQILHADDKIHPNYAALMLAARQRWDTATAFFCRAAAINENGDPFFSVVDFIKPRLAPTTREPFTVNGEAGLASLLQGWFIVCPTLCFRKDLLGGRRFNPRWRFDVDLSFTTQLLLDGHTLVGLPDVACNYRRHPNSQTTRFTSSMVRFEEERELYDELAVKASARGWTHAADIARRRTIIKRYLAFCSVKDLVHGHLSDSRAKLAFLQTL